MCACACVCVTLCAHVCACMLCASESACGLMGRRTSERTGVHVCGWACGMRARVPTGMREGCKRGCMWGCLRVCVYGCVRGWVCACVWWSVRACIRACVLNLINLLGLKARFTMISIVFACERCLSLQEKMVDYWGIGLRVRKSKAKNLMCELIRCKTTILVEVFFLVNFDWSREEQELQFEFYSNSYSIREWYLFLIEKVIFEFECKDRRKHPNSPSNTEWISNYTYFYGGPISSLKYFKTDHVTP